MIFGILLVTISFIVCFEPFQNYSTTKITISGYLGPHKRQHNIEGHWKGNAFKGPKEQEGGRVEITTKTNFEKSPLHKFCLSC